MISWRILLAALLACFCSATASFACIFCSPSNIPTMTGDYHQASAVMIVHVEHGPKLNSRGEFETEVTIDQVLKAHDFLKGKKVLTLKRQIDKTDSQFL